MSKITPAKASAPATPAADTFADLLDPARVAGRRDFDGGTLERRSLAEQVANRIMAMIKSGNLKSATGCRPRRRWALPSAFPDHRCARP